MYKGLSSLDVYQHIQNREKQKRIKVKYDVSHLSNHNIIV